MNINISNQELIKLTVNNDENKVIEFDPLDVNLFVEIKKISLQLKEIDSNNLEELNKMCCEIDIFINKFFGKNATLYLFNNRKNIYMYSEFIKQLIPLIDSKRKKLIDKYINNETA